MHDPRPDSPTEPPAQPPGPFGWPGLGRYLRGPEGLGPLSQRPRDVVIRWAGFAVIVAILLVFIGVMLVARRG